MQEKKSQKRKKINVSDFRQKIETQRFSPEKLKHKIKVEGFLPLPVSSYCFTIYQTFRLSPSYLFVYLVVNTFEPFLLVRRGERQDFALFPLLPLQPTI